VKEDNSKKKRMKVKGADLSTRKRKEYKRKSWDKKKEGRKFTPRRRGGGYIEQEDKSTEKG